MLSIRTLDVTASSPYMHNYTSNCMGSYVGEKFHHLHWRAVRDFTSLTV